MVPMSAKVPADPILRHLEKARRQISEGDLSGAARTLNEARALSPHDARLFMLAALMAEKSGNIDGAFDAMQRCNAIAPGWGPGLLEMALLQARHNRSQEAIATAERVAVLEPRNPQVLAAVVDIAHRAGHTEMAIRHLERGLGLVPGDRMLRSHLAQDLAQLGRYDAALAHWQSLIDEDPSDIAARLGRIRVLQALGAMEQARPDTEALLALAPGNPVAQYYDQIARGQTPAQVPAELTTPLFDAMAGSYDQHMVRQLQYRLPRQVADQLLELYPDRRLNVLDLGCGTGLLGACLAPLEGYIVGVELSAPMIEQAARHNVYYRFHRVNLLDALRETPDSTFDVIAALDVFIYVGDLQQAIADAHRILVPGGRLIFSCEHGDANGSDVQLRPSDRYAHRLASVQQQCLQAGFKFVQVRETELRQEAGQPVPGFVIMATKAKAAPNAQAG